MSCQLDGLYDRLMARSGDSYDEMPDLVCVPGFGWRTHLDTAA
jgi:hypothetical protein